MEIPIVRKFPFIDYGRPKDVGRPNHVDMSIILAAIKEYMKADEVELAIWILDHLPSYYKDNPPPEFVELRRKIFEQCLTTQDYIFDNSGERLTQEEIINYYNHPSQLRFKIVAEKVKALNDQGITPHITELGAGEFWLAVGMKQERLSFTYYPIVLNQDHLLRAEELLGPMVQPRKNCYEMYVCMETAEHLWSPQEIFHYYARYKIQAQYLAFSTPKYTCLGGMPDWEQKPIGHIRAWSPKQFHSFLSQYFYGFTWRHIDSDLMVFIGESQTTAYYQSP